jgi:hypothetical protein
MARGYFLGHTNSSGIPLILAALMFHRENILTPGKAIHPVVSPPFIIPSNVTIAIRQVLFRFKFWGCFTAIRDRLPHTMAKLVMQMAAGFTCVTDDSYPEHH